MDKREFADKNFITTKAKKPEYEYHNYSEFDLEGLLFFDENGGKFYRLPRRILADCTENMQEVAQNSAGAVLKFRTNSKKITVHCEYEYHRCSSSLSQLADAGFDLYRIKDGKYEFCCCLYPSTEDETLDMEWTISDNDECFEYALYLPLFSTISNFYIGVQNGSVIEKSRNTAPKKRLLVYGSSISQGACVSRPGITYAAITARTMGFELLNCGYSGNCRGELAIADEFVKKDFDCFIYEYDHNAPNSEFLRKTHKPFFDRIRSVKKDVPIIIMSRPDFTAGARGDEAERNKVVLDTYNTAVANGDKNVYFIDLSEVFNGYERSDLTPDRVHPNDFGAAVIANKICEVMRNIF